MSSSQSSRGVYPHRATFWAEGKSHAIGRYPNADEAQSATRLARAMHAWPGLDPKSIVDHIQSDRVVQEARWLGLVESPGWGLPVYVHPKELSIFAPYGYRDGWGGGLRERRQWTDRKGYLYFELWKRKIRSHRAVLAAWLGRPLLEHEIGDHIDGDPKNNHPRNLRLVSKAENAINTAYVRAGSFPGVKESGGSKAKPWRASIKDGERDIHLGCYRTQEEAAEAYWYAWMDKHGRPPVPPGGEGRVAKLYRALASEVTS